MLALIWLACYAGATLLTCEKREQKYQSALARYHEAKPTTLSNPAYGQVPFVWYLAEPLWDCETLTRVGVPLGDGAKYMCDIERLVKRGADCVYYGFGVNGDVEFERDLITRFVRCRQMFAFDPTPSVTHSYSSGSSNSLQTLATLGVEFVPIGISDTDGAIVLENRLVPAKKLDTIRTELGHANRVIDVLKIDVEGAEWNVLIGVFASCDRRLPLAHQILVEVHGVSKTLLIGLLDAATSCGYRLFSKDPNHYAPHVYELAFVHEAFVACQ